jgi:hypothetical protein
MDQSTLLAHKQSQMEEDLPDNATESIALPWKFYDCKCFTSPLNTIIDIYNC